VLLLTIGITGLIIAQGLKKYQLIAYMTPCAGFDMTLRPASTTRYLKPTAHPYRTRTRDWGIHFHWAIPFLKQCLELATFSHLKETQVDPFFEHPEHDAIQCFNGETGELIQAIPLQHFVRLRGER
jgi:hypothetical protein